MKTQLFNTIRWFFALLLFAGVTDKAHSNSLHVKWGGVNTPIQLELIVPDTLLLPYCELGEITVRVTNTSSSPVLAEQVRLYNEGSIIFPVGLGDFDADFGNQNPCGGGPQVSLDLRTDQVVIPANSFSDFSVTIQLTNNCGEICNSGGYSRIFATVDSEYVVPSVEKRVFQEKMCLLDGEDQTLNLSEVWNPAFYNISHNVYYAIMVRGEVVVDFFDPQASIGDQDVLGPGKIEFNGVFDNLIMAPGARLTIDEDVSLTIRRSTDPRHVTIRGCESMWNTIDVKGRLVLGNATVRDAQHGITVRDGASINFLDIDFVDNYVGIFIPPKEASSKYGDFNNINRQAFFYLNFFNTGSFLPAFDGQEFIPEETGFAGIEAYQLKSFNLSGVHGVSTSLRNSYKGLANGIVLHQSSAVIADSYFEDILELEETTYPFSGRAISVDKALLQGTPPAPMSLPSLAPPTWVKGWGGGPSAEEDEAMFDNCTYGVYTIDADLVLRDAFMNDQETGVYFSEGLHRHLRVLDNVILSTQNGVHGQSNVGGFASVSENYFLIQQSDATQAYGVRIEDPGLSARWNVNFNLFHIDRESSGTFLQNTSNALIRQNDFISLPTLNSQEAFGTRIEGGFGNAISCNYFEGRDNYSAYPPNIRQEAGIVLRGAGSTDVACNRFQKMQHSVQALDMNNSSTIRGNEFESYYRALVLGKTDIPFAAIGQQTHRGNNWTDMTPLLDTYNWYGAFNHSTDDASDGSILDSRFIVDDNLNPDFMPKWNTGAGMNVPWFVSLNDDFDLTFYCPEAPTCVDYSIGAGFTWDSLDEKLYQDSLAATSYSKQLTWAGRKQLYRNLQNDPAAWSGHTAATAFYNLMQQESPGKFVNEEEALRSRMNLDSAQQVSLNELLDAMIDGLERLYSVDSTLYTQGSSPDSALLVQHAATLDSLEVWMEHKEALYHDLFDGLEDDLNDLQTDLALLPDSENIELSHILVQEILIDLLLSGSMQPDSAQTETLTLVALQCPLDGGESVYAARALLGMGHVSTDSLCTDGQTAKALPNANGALSLQPPYPNPADTEVWVSLPAAEGTMQLMVVNAQGQLQWQQQVPGREQQQTLRIITADWAPGVYYLVLQLPNGQRMQQRVSIVH